MTNRQNFRRLLWLLLPFALWCFIFRDFLNGRISLVNDARTLYYMTKYYLDALVQGIYPLWNPFLNWGKPDNLDGRFFGEFNPLFWVIPALHALKVPYYAAYTVFLAGYWFLESLGVYFLARRLFRQPLFAYISYLLFLFCPLGPTMFSHTTINQVLIAMVWLYFFIVSFHQRPDRGSLLGLTFCLMLLVVTYSIGHFLTILLITALLFGAACARSVPGIVKHWAMALWSLRGTAALCVIALCLACLPGLFWIMESHHAERNAVHFTHSGFKAESGGDYSLAAIMLGSSATQVDFHMLFSNIEHFRLKDPMFLYIHAFVLVVLILSLANRINRLSFICGFSALLLFLISLGDVTPVYIFLYRHLPFFKKFRNLYFFLLFAYPFAIFWTVEQTRLLVEKITAARHKTKMFWIAWVAAAHLSVYVWLLRLPEAIWSFPATVLLSLLWWVLVIWSYPLRSRAFPLYAATLVMLCTGPFHILQAMMANHVSKPAGYPNQVEKIAFKYERPPREYDTELFQKRSDYFKKVSRDSSGFRDEQHHYLGTPWSYQLNRNAPYEQLFPYVKYKFWIYPQVTAVPQADLADYYAWQDHYRSHAFIHGELPADQKQALTGGPGTPVTGPSQELTVERFTHNRVVVRTNFQKPEFLVYNDSYSPLWNAYLNGRKAALYRANYAFKGIFVPAGPNRIVFRFQTLPYLILFYVIQAVFTGILAALIFDWSRPKDRGHSNEAF